MKRTTVFFVAIFAVSSLLMTGCVQKSAHDNVVSALSSRAEVAEERARLAEDALNIAEQRAVDLEKMLNRFSKEVTIWAPVDNQLVSESARILNHDKVEKQAEDLVALLLEKQGMPEGGKLVRAIFKADTVSLTLSSEFKTGFPTNEAMQKLVLGAIVDTLTELPEIKKVSITTVGGALQVGKTTLGKALLRGDALLAQ